MALRVGVRFRLQRTRPIIHDCSRTALWRRLQGGEPFRASSFERVSQERGPPISRAGQAALDGARPTAEADQPAVTASLGPVYHLDRPLVMAVPRLRHMQQTQIQTHTHTRIHTHDDDDDDDDDDTRWTRRVKLPLLTDSSPRLLSRGSLCLKGLVKIAKYQTDFANTVWNETSAFKKTQ
jgi:hypothetical protein